MVVPSEKELRPLVSQTPEPGRAPERSVLIVEDDPEVGAVLAEVVQNVCDRVEVIHNGLDALIRLRRCQVPFGLILTDLEMPRVDGFEFLRRAKVIAPETPVVVISIHADERLRLKALALGASDVVGKPFQVEEIRRVVRMVMSPSQ